MTTTARRVDVRPRRLYCPIERHHTSRALADDAVAGRFTNASLTLALGLPPDWHDPRLPVDEEWRIEWSKLYVGLDLAHTYRETGDRIYLDTWQELVGSWIDQVPVDFDDSDVTGRRLQNWIYAWEGFARSPDYPGLRPELAERLLRSIADQTAHLRANVSPERNHRTLELYGLLVVALALPTLDPSGGLARFALAALSENLATDVWADGVQRECSTHYHLIALRSFVGAVENARRFGLDVDDAYLDRLGRAVDFAVHCHRPDGGIPALSDSDGGDHSEVLTLAARLLDRPDARYVATRGREGTPPAERRPSFPVGGYHVQRSGWGVDAPYTDERFLIFDCGPLGDGGHGHYDMLAVEIAAHGRPLVMDPGRFTYSEDGPVNWRRYFKGTAAHSTVCVDGLDQQPYRRGRPAAPLAGTRLLARIGCDEIDLIRGEARSPAYDAVHERTVVFVAGEYWIIVDHLTADTLHRYDLRFQLSPDADGAVEVDGQTVNAPGVRLAFAGGPPRVEGAWVAPEYGSRLPAPAVVATLDGRSATFATAIVPAPTRTPNAVSVLGPTTVAVHGAGGADSVDIVSWRADAGPLSLGPLSCEGDLAWARIDANGAITRASVHGLRFSTPRGRRLRARRDGEWVHLEAAAT